MRRLAAWLYGAALTACPPGFRRRFGARMREDFARLLAEQRDGPAALRLALREAIDVVVAAWSAPRGGGVGIRRRRASGARHRLQLVADDARFAVRALAARPGYTVVAVLTLALGIGAATIVFSVIDNVVIRPLPYRDADRIVWLFSDDLTRERASQMPSTPADFLDWRERSTAFESMAASRTRGAVLTGGDYPQRVVVHEVTDGTFAMLGVPATLGRTLGPDSTGRPRRPARRHRPVRRDGLQRGAAPP